MYSIEYIFNKEIIRVDVFNQNRNCVIWASCLGICNDILFINHQNDGIKDMIEFFVIIVVFGFLVLTTIHFSTASVPNSPQQSTKLAQIQESIALTSICKNGKILTALTSQRVAKNIKTGIKASTNNTNNPMSLANDIISPSLSSNKTTIFPCEKTVTSSSNKSQAARTLSSDTDKRTSSTDQATTTSFTD